MIYQVIEVSKYLKPLLFVKAPIFCLLVEIIEELSNFFA